MVDEVYFFVVTDVYILQSLSSQFVHIFQVNLFCLISFSTVCLGGGLFVLEDVDLCFFLIFILLKASKHASDVHCEQKENNVHLVTDAVSSEHTAYHPCSVL
jgi:hypothetical protein